MFVIDRTGLSVVADLEIEGTYYLRQKALLYKTSANEDDGFATMGDDGAQDLGDLVTL